MRFYITRTSSIYNTEKPCENAKINVNSIDDGDQYYIEIKTIKELRELIDEVGHPLIVKRDGFLSTARAEEAYSIEIYDDWRE